MSPSLPETCLQPSAVKSDNGETLSDTEQSFERSPLQTHTCSRFIIISSYFSKRIKSIDVQRVLSLVLQLSTSTTTEMNCKNLKKRNKKKKENSPDGDKNLMNLSWI